MILVLATPTLSDLFAIVMLLRIRAEGLLQVSVLGFGLSGCSVTGTPTSCHVSSTYPRRQAVNSKQVSDIIAMQTLIIRRKPRASLDLRATSAKPSTKLQTLELSTLGPKP